MDVKWKSSQLVVIAIVMYSLFSVARVIDFLDICMEETQGGNK